MSRAYTTDGRRISSMTHAKRAHVCSICGVTSMGNGGKVAHGRAHVRRGEAVELVKNYEFDMSPFREFFAPDDPAVERLLARGCEVVPSDHSAI